MVWVQKRVACQTFWFELLAAGHLVYQLNAERSQSQRESSNLVFLSTAQPSH